MGCLCCKEDGNAERRHPLLREQQPSSSGPPKVVTSDDFNNIENRALVDSLRGPPLVVPMKGGIEAPDIVRTSLNGFMRLESFRLPENISAVVWCKIHLKEIIEHVRVFNVLIHPQCNRKSCKIMAGPPTIDYKWNCGKDGLYSADINKSMSASVYIEKVIDTTTMLLKTHFRKSLVEMDETTYEVARTIVSLIFRVYCHVLYHHHDLFVSSYALPHLNSCFTWFILFASEAGLLDAEESQPLAVLIADIVKIGHSGAPLSSQADDEGLQLSMCHDDRMSSFLNSLSSSDDISKLTASSYSTTNTFFSCL